MAAIELKGSFGQSESAVTKEIAKFEILNSKFNLLMKTESLKKERTTSKVAKRRSSASAALIAIRRLLTNTSLSGNHPRLAVR